MIEYLPIIKGLHPGILLGRELSKRNIPKGRFAITVNEFPQTLGAIIKGKRNMNTPLALRIERELGWEEGFLMTMQVYYDIKVEKNRQYAALNIKPPNVRRILFWDTSLEKINWLEHKRAVIRRVFERGNEEEKEEITRFYGQDEIDRVLDKP